VLSNTGRHDEALAVIQQALAVDPLSLIVGAMRGQFLYHAGRDSASVEQFKATLGMEPRFWVGQICAAKTYEKLGMYSEASQPATRRWSILGATRKPYHSRLCARGPQGTGPKQKPRFVRCWNEAAALRTSYNVALVFAGLGETERALQLLQQAFEERDVHMPFLLDHKWDRLRSKAQFQELLSRVGFTRSTQSV